MTRQVRLQDFLTPDEIRRAREVQTAKRICDEIIKPQMHRINEALGQDNDPLYLAYSVEYVIGRAFNRGGQNG
jgi:hypothetical protein